MYPVPVTMQTLAIVMVGALAGPRLGAAMVLSWLGLAMMGAPVLAGGKGRRAGICRANRGIPRGVPDRGFPRWICCSRETCRRALCGLPRDPRADPRHGLGMAGRPDRAGGCARGGRYAFPDRGTDKKRARRISSGGFAEARLNRPDETYSEQVPAVADRPGHNRPA